MCVYDYEGMEGQVNAQIFHDSMLNLYTSGDLLPIFPLFLGIFFVKVPNRIEEKAIPRYLLRKPLIKQ